MQKNEDNTATFKAAGTVDEQSAVSARITLSKQNLKDHRPDMEGSDERMLESMKELYQQIRV